MRSFPLALLLPLPACTFGPGGAFGVLGDATIEAGFVPGAARDLGDGWFLTDEGYEVRTDTLAVEVGNVRLLSLGGSGPTSFDPSSPPPGYTLCHGGHCHAEDGRLVDYADVEAELAGGGAAAFTTLATLPVGARLDLLAGERVAIEADGGPDLPRAEVSKVEVDVVRVSLDAEATGGSLGGGSVRLIADLALSAVVGAGAEATIDEDHPGTLVLAARYEVDGTFLDGLDLAALDDGDGEVTFYALDDPGAEPLAANLLAAGLGVELAQVD